MIKFLDVLKQVAADRGEQALRIRYDGVVTAQPSYQDPDDGSMVYFLSWSLPTPPTQAEIDAVVANPPPGLGDPPPSETPIAEIVARLTTLEGQSVSSQVAIATAQQDILDLQLLIAGKAEFIYRAAGDPVPAGVLNAILVDESMDILFSWNAEASEWLSIETLTDGGGVNGNVGNGTPFRRYNGMTMSADTGLPMPEAIQLRLMSGWCDWIGTPQGATIGAVEVLLEGAVIATIDEGTDRTRSVTKFFDVTDPTLRFIPDFNANVWLRWVGSTTSRPQALLSFKFSLVPA